MDASLLIRNPAVGVMSTGRIEATPGVMPSSSELLSDVWNDATPGLARTAMALGIRRDAVDDVLQEVWLSAWQNRPSLLDTDSLRRWLYRVLVNRCRLHQRQAARWRRAVEVIAGMWTSSQNNRQESVAGQSPELQLEVAVALAQLAPLQREIVVLRYFSEFDSREIGDMLGVSDSTVRSHLRIARQQLARHLADWSPPQ